jgi:uncharacterized protein YkwD
MLLPVRSLSRAAVRRAVGGTVTGGVTFALLLGSGAGAEASIHTNNRKSVAKAYAKLLRAEATRVSWSGSTASCRAGSDGAASRRATLTAVNFFRQLGGLRPVKFTGRLNARAQKAALLMDANNRLSHTPSKGWRCSTSTGRTAAGRSNIALGISGASTVRAYMPDFGSGNLAVGHRRWIMYPPTKTMGAGSTGRANALWVVGSQRKNPARTPAWVSWPTPGYVPADLEPEGRWSLSSTNPKMSFRSAKVRVRDAHGHWLKVKKYKVHDGYANNTLVWKVSGLRTPKRAGQVSYRVVVTGIKKAGTKKRYTRAYSVRFFNPEYYD